MISAFPATCAAMLLVVPNVKNAGAGDCMVTVAGELLSSFALPGLAITRSVTGPVVVVVGA